ncbi:SLC13 family permease [uncultured Bilophila sp.]|uniref:SLC13 family permease n=1 Tax=uncultured Bilophila sp. TaxID=529385 RepID=UPI00280BDF7B|nr:SLC13 family permease [uncultured Bilophila sp.]
MQLSGIVRHKRLISFIVVMLISVIPLMFPCTQGYTLQIKLFSVFTLFAILSIACNLIPLVVPSVLLPVAYFFFQVADMKVVYAPWTSSTLWMMFGAFVLANALEECKLMERIAYCILKFFGASYNTLLYGIYCVGLVLAIITFNGHYILMMFLAYSICKALRYGHSRESLLLLVVGGLAAMNIKIFAYRPATMLMMVNGVRKVAPDFDLTMLQQMTYALPSLFIGISFIWMLTKLFHTSDITFEGGRTYFKKKSKELGEMNSKEKKAAVLLAIIMLWILTEPFHKLPAALAFMALPWLCFVPGIDIATENSVKKLNWGIMFFIATCLCIGNVGSQIGVTKLITDSISPFLHHVEATGFLYLVLLLGTILNFILTPMALMATLPEPIAVLSQNLDINAAISLITIIYSTDMIFLPFEAAAYLIMFGFGLMTLKEFVKVHTLKCLWYFLLFGLVQIPFWHLLDIVYTHH